MSDITLYQIIDWNTHFENSRSRSIGACTWVGIPNKHHGAGFQRILTSQDGLAIYGLWCLIVQACSRQGTGRDGWLTDDGTPAGYPWDATDLATRWHQPVDLVQRGLELLCSSRIGWLRSFDQVPAAASTMVSADSNTVTPPGDDRPLSPDDSPSQGAARREGNGTEENRTPPTSASPKLTRFQGVEKDAVRRALDRADLWGLIAAFHANTAIERQADWQREADQVVLHEILVIFAWRRRERDNIREPSGLRKALEAWRSVPLQERRSLALALLEDYGVESPTSLKSGHAEEGAA